MPPDTLKPKLEPKYDVVFLSLFGDKHEPELLLSLLNALLADHQPPMVAVEITPTRLPGQFVDNKTTLLDLCATDERGRQYNVEVQLSRKAAYAERALYYWARLFAAQLKQGHLYTELRPTIGIHLLDWTSPTRADGSFHHSFHITDDLTGRRLTDHLSLHILELPRFNLALEDLGSDEDKWLYFIKNGHTMTHKQAQNLGAPIGRAEQKLAHMSQEDVLRFQAFMIDKRLRDEANHIPDLEAEARQRGLEQGLEQGLELGLEQGLEQGLERGLVQGLEQGLEQGRAEGLHLVLLMWERSLGRPLSQAERDHLKDAAHSLEHLGRMAFERDKDEIEGWLKAP